MPYPIYGYRINPYSIMRRFSPDILDNQNVQLNTYKRLIENYGEANDKIVNSALMKRGIYLIENAIMLGIAHPDCYWFYGKQKEWVKRLLDLSWVQSAAEYAVKS